MASLADLAAAAEVGLEGTAGALPEAPELKRKRAAPLDAAMKTVGGIRSSLERARGKLLLAQSATGLARSKPAQKKVDTAVEKVAKFSRQLQDAEAKVSQLKESARLAAEVAESKRVASDEKAESSKNLSDAALMLIVELRIRFQPKFDNSSDTAVNIWPHIHAEYLKKITDGTLAGSDRISSAQLQRRWSLELGKFRLWCSVANRAMTLSGVTRDKVEDDVSVHDAP